MAEKLDKTSYSQQKLRALTPSASRAAVAATGAATEEVTPTLTPAKTGKITYQRTNYCTCLWAFAPAPTSAAS